VADLNRDGGESAYEDAARLGLLQSLLLRVRQVRQGQELPVHCAWCDRVKRGEAWVLGEVRTARFLRRPAPEASHGICPECLARLTPRPRS
jgi:hypothetical protein